MSLRGTKQSRKDLVFITHNGIASPASPAGRLKDGLVRNDGNKTMKDLQIHFMTFCDYAMTSQEGKLSIIGIFDEIRVAQFPGGVASASLVAMVKGKPDTSYALKIQGDKGKKNIFPPIEVAIRTGMSGGSNITINLNNLAFPEAGEYVFKIMLEEKEVGSTVLKIVEASKQQKGMTYSLPN